MKVNQKISRVTGFVLFFVGMIGVLYGMAQLASPVRLLAQLACNPDAICNATIAPWIPMLIGLYLAAVGFHLRTVDVPQAQ